jgi:BirA family transcriptional regulator, biotin operon repressor / biotin---[acetyl-CoA-carboxylase] ligase
VKRAPDVPPSPSIRSPLRRSEIVALSRGGRFTRDLRSLGLVPSVLDVVADLARRGAKDGLVVVADGQTRGRGRRGDFWSSTPGAGLYVAALARPAPTAAEAPLFAAAIGLSAAAAVEEAAGLSAKLKWPNDVWCDDAKTGGVLVESVFGADGYAAIGVGLTLAAPPEGSVNPGVAPIRGLEDMAARPISRERLLAALLDALEARLHDVVAAPDLLRAEYRARDALLGRTVGFETQDGIVRGVVESSDVVDGLVVAQKNGARLRLRAAHARVVDVER